MPVMKEKKPTSKDPFKEIVELLEEYDKDTPKRDPKFQDSGE
jgi:hypothetical protein